jgi:hypothetical protein
LSHTRTPSPSVLPPQLPKKSSLIAYVLNQGTKKRPESASNSRFIMSLSDPLLLLCPALHFPPFLPLPHAAAQGVILLAYLLNTDTKKRTLHDRDVGVSQTLSDPLLLPCPPFRIPPFLPFPYTAAQGVILLAYLLNQGMKKRTLRT